MKRILFVLIISAASLPVAEAQDLTQPYIWIGLEFGPGYHPEYDDAVAGKVEYQMQIDRHLITINYLSVGEVLSSHYAASVMYGRVISPLDWKVMAAVSTGASYVSDRHAPIGLFGGSSGSSSRYEAIGLPVQLNLQFRMYRYFAFATTVSGNINRNKSFGGVTFGIHIGKFW